MKKTIFIVGGFALALCGFMFARQSETENLPELQMENIEALSADEPNNPCRYVNGFKKSYLDPDPAKENPRREVYRDCCYEEKVGYDPYGECI